MLHRIFIAINLPEEIKSKLISFQKKWPTLPCRWTKSENLHITLIFLGNLDDNQLNDTVQIAHKVGERHKPFLIKLKRICFGPPKKFPPRMVWVEGELNQHLLNLVKDLEDSIFNLPSYKYKEREKRPYSPHITLGRLKVWEFRRMEERPKVDQLIDLTFEVNSFEIMESFLKRSGAEYEVLDSVPLGSN